VNSRYRVTLWHGECRSLFYVIDTEADEVMATFDNRLEAEGYIRLLVMFGGAR